MTSDDAGRSAPKTAPDAAPDIFPETRGPDIAPDPAAAGRAERHERALAEIRGANEGAFAVRSTRLVLARMRHGAGEGLRQAYRNRWTAAIGLLAAALSLLHLYFAIYPELTDLTRNAIHFGGFALLAAMTTPLMSSNRWLRESRASRMIDLAFGVAVCASAVYLALSETAFYELGDLSTAQWIAGGIVVFGALELTRRTSGWVIPILATIGLTYVFWWGPYAPDPFTFRGLSLKTTLVAAVYEDEGMFGNLARISSTVIFLFIVFGAFLVRSGAGDFVIAIARAAAGKMVGGPGVIAVISSALTGTISGSAVANTASTGVITIPLMKRAGYSPAFAGAVEAASSTGGQLMPPIMGAGAFVMASYTNIPYETIIAAAALPALLYFASVAFFVRIEARKLGLGAFEDDGPTVGQALKMSGASFIVPITIVIGMLIAGYTASYAAVFGVIAVIVSSWLTDSPMGPRAIWEALVLGARNMAFMAVLLCTVALLVNAIVKASVGPTFSLMIAQWSQGEVLIAILLIAIASLVLGMGLPVTAAYIVLATLSGPMLAGLITDQDVIQAIATASVPDQAAPLLMLTPGIPDPTIFSQPMPEAEAAALYLTMDPFVQDQLRQAIVDPATAASALLSAHMIIFWLSQDSNVTPPVALAAFTASAIAKASAMRTGFLSWKIAKGLYIVPVLFATTPILSGDWGQAFLVFGLALVGIYGLAGALSGAMEDRLSVIERALAGVAGIACLWYGEWAFNVGGVLVVFGLLALSIWRLSRRSDDGAAAEA